MSALAEAVPAAERIVVPVALAERSYDIMIGRHQLKDAAEAIARLAPGARAAIVTDENLAALHAPALESCLHRAGVTTTRLTVPPGEATKSYARFIELCDGLLAAKIERNDLVIALGGGVVGDLSASPPRSCAAASGWCRSRPVYSPRSIPPSAARPASIPATART
jgi:3-dehydroquinate synthetase